MGSNTSGDDYTLYSNSLIQNASGEVTFTVTPTEGAPIAPKMAKAMFASISQTEAQAASATEPVIYKTKLGSDGTAEQEIEFPDAGNYVISAAYSGNSYYEPGESANKVSYYSYNSETGQDFNMSSSIVALDKDTYVYDGKECKPGVTVTWNNVTLEEGTDYTVTYSNYVKVGKATAKITLKGNYSGTITKTYLINPVKTYITSLSKGTKSFTVKWSKKKSSDVSGYQVRYSTKSSMSSAKTTTISSYKSYSKTVKSLKAKKTYYVQVRTYKKVSGKTYYSTWSSSKKVKTK